MDVATAPEVPATAVDSTVARPLFSVEQLSEHARLLAVEHQAVIHQGPNRLLPRLDENEERLRDYNQHTYVADKARQITPASEWILDNFYLIEEQIQIARRHLPRRYSRELPRLMTGRSAGLPRVYDVILGFVTHVDAQLEMVSIEAFLSAYQVVTPLKLGELWAVPIMFRLALIENLRRITDRLTLSRADRDLADKWALKLETTSEKQPSQVVVVVAEMAKANLPLTSSFVAEFHQRLARSSTAVPMARSWLDQRLGEQHLTIEQLVRAESQSQAADQVSVSHSITGLRVLNSWDWRAFVESQSIVERILRTDPADIYRQMDFATRDSYRHAVETFARHGGQPESSVAERAVNLAEESAHAKGREDRSAHVGFYLVDGGRRTLERKVPVSWPVSAQLERMVVGFPVWYYIGSIVTGTVAATALALLEAHYLGVSNRRILFFAPVVLICMSQLAVALVNWVSSLITGPRLLPRLDYTGGVPPESRTMVVIPTLIPDEDAVDHLLETIEIHFLSNRDSNLTFALLTDFPDAKSEVLPTDTALRERMKKGISELNTKYGSSKNALFYLFHRPRKWNASENRWMGYERKRGKLSEFNALLRGGDPAPFQDIVGDMSLLPGVKFVLTLDTDTQLPRNAAQMLAATMAHPLNRPRFDPAKGIVVEGYGILQPRVGVSLPGSGRSLFARMFSGDVGIDPYTKGVSDVYQDIFNEGSFIGKGLYDVDAFERAVGGRFPENAVLSHDLIESCYARSALVTDVELYEEYPSKYMADVKRRHRWIRGDWQIAQWLLRRVPGGVIRRTSNPLSVLSQWKILDNLRRSLAPLALLLLLLGSWAIIPWVAGWVTLLVLAIIAAPTLVTAAYELSRKPEDLPLVMHASEIGESLGRQLSQILLSLTFLPYDAFVSTDAIVRTLLRMFVTRRSLLEWVPSSEASKKSNLGLWDFYMTMWAAPVLAIALAAIVAYRQPWLLPIAFPFMGLWLLAPMVAWRISLPIERKQESVSEDQVYFLRAVARKTWHFFETFVNAEENWLPPDNHQEQPVVRTASRTSPTNMGLSLLGNLAARDFGYLSVGELLSRTRNSLDSMDRLEKYRGHFYNWYDTRSMKALEPLYVSSVDSGNLAGHLLTLATGLRELPDQELLPDRVFDGLSDTCGVLLNSIDKKNAVLVRLCGELARGSPATLAGRVTLLRLASDLANQLKDITPPEAETWAARLREGAKRELDDVLLMAPWLGAIVKPGSQPVPDHVLERPTLRQVAEPAPGRPGSDAARERMEAIEDLAARTSSLAEMDFTFLYDPARKVFVTGYNVITRRKDNSYYDLLASEARLTSYVAVALGQVGQDHWFALGRLLVAGHGEPILASWSGSMFEYLMPMLVMPTYENTLLADTCAGAVERQIEYGRTRGIPWGISESGYNITDAQLNYQYRAFGVPGLGLKRGLGEDLVVSPYSTVMALMVSPHEACDNLERLDADGRSGAYGFYEAIDYTPSRVPAGQDGATVRSYMVHHQGMSLLALTSFLLDRPMQRRFMECPVLRTSDLLLQEKVPHASAKIHSKELEVQEARKQLEREAESSIRVFSDVAAQSPEVHLLSNGTYHLVVSHVGGGYSRWKNFSLNRWREDSAQDSWGTFIYLRDTATREYWSAAPQPVMQPVKRQETIFSQGRAEFRHNHLGIEVYTEISVSPEDDVELRRVTLTNPSHARRVIEVTGYLEVVLAPASAEEAHPAFSGLFVQTEFSAHQSAVLCTRRARQAGENPPWMFALMPPPPGDESAVSCETDRSKFVGRGKSPSSPAALQQQGALSNTAGSVLDPVIALRRMVSVPPGGEVSIVFAIGISDSRAGAQALIEKYSSTRVAARTFELAWTHSQVSLRQLNATEGQAQLYARLASALVYAQPARRANPAVLISNRSGQDGLWRHGISGDLPIVLVVISDASRVDFVQQVIQAHAYWRVKGLEVDLVILNGDDSTYRQPLQDEIVALINSGIESQMLGKPGGIFVLRLDQIGPVDRTLLQAVARIVLMAEAGSLEDQLNQTPAKTQVAAALRPSRAPVRDASAPAPARDLIHFNGLGGFTRDGREYVITLTRDQVTPAPWINVIANPDFGTIVSESGSSYTWSENCHEFRLTPWNNDPVVDPSGEAFYIRDEETGQFWSPSPQPVRGVTPYTVRHGLGYSVFEHAENGLSSELTIFVATDAPVKFVVCKVRNTSTRPRKISITGYWEWVLGDLRRRGMLHVQTEIDADTGALLARNRFQSDFADRIAFVDVSEPSRSVTGDRLEFLGRFGTPARPASMQRTRLSGRVGAGLDPAGAMQVAVDLAPGQEREITFRIGAGKSIDHVRDLVRRYRNFGAVRGALEQAWEYWARTLGTVNIDTPDSSVNVLVNGWLPYQVLASRLWGRTGFYQSGGAFGFRDQLQDVMALVHAEPALTRKQILLAASRQFPEGDVQHWWHPPGGRGVRTKVSDDYLWLPYVACKYSLCTADTGVWDEPVPYLSGRLLKEHEESYYDMPGRSEETRSLYEHCVSAVERSLAVGSHGLPLMGSGDWNDGMNLVGIEGRGESVWLAFFLCDVLRQFAEVAKARSDAAMEAKCEEHVEKLKAAIEKEAWDGAWYKRAFFDDGTPLGSSSNPECQIDSLPQSWSIISGCGDAGRSETAMKSVSEHLVRKEAGLIQLFDPPFDHSSMNPGYIKGYIPGVRENGGQYTHAAVWTVMASALRGDHDKAWELFQLMNPVRHGGTPARVAVYKVEPYVIAADVYALPPHTGRGGWTWYTGSAGWLYRTLVETLMGVNLRGESLLLTPRLPAGWSTAKVHYRFRQTVYHITYVRSAAGSAPGRPKLDGQELEGPSIPLRDDRTEHTVEFPFA